jgi:hypothetical protein
MKLTTSFVLTIAFSLRVVPALALSHDDQYLAGYAAAVLEREFKVPARSVRVEQGVISVRSSELGNADADAVRAALAAIPGAAGVRLITDDAAAVAPAETPPSHGARRDAAMADVGFLPDGELFRPLLADPRWPRFSAVYRYYRHDPELGSVGAANFGATVPLYRAHVPSVAESQWEAGLQAAVLSIFDLEAESKDLINADYFVSLFATYRLGDVAALGRVLHQSSHLGDEFLLRNRVQRVNLSYEAIDLIVSHDVLDAVRLYGGGSYLFDQEPSDLDPGLAHYGVEVTSPWRLAAGAVTPVAAADFQNTEESNWTTQYSVLGGFQLERVRIANRALLVAFEWFRGQSPNGQFYRRKVEWLGIGAHLYF